MNPTTLLIGALFVGLLSSVAAVPQFAVRDEHCTATVTVCSSMNAHLSSSTTSAAPTDGGEPSPGGKTVTVLDTTTIFSTIYASAGSGALQTKDSPISGGPRTVTVTVTNVQTITQDHSIFSTYTVTQTLTPANNAPTAINEAVSVQPTSLPYYSNSTSTTASSRAAVATGYPNASVSSNYQNGLYFTNWYVPLICPAHGE